MTRTAFVTALLISSLFAPIGTLRTASAVECGVTESMLLGDCILNEDPMCMLGDTRALVIFAMFKDFDTTDAYQDSNACYRWHEARTALYPWMSSFLADTCSVPGNCPPPTTAACSAVTISNSATEPSLTSM